MVNHLRELYKEGKCAIGTFFNMGDASSMECLGYTGLDYVIIDTEHGPFDTETMMDMIRIAESVSLTPVVRIANVDHKEIQRAVDCGAQGLIIPCLRAVDDFKKVVDLAKFAPVGNRGFVKGRGAGFGNKPWACGTIQEYMDNSNERLMVVPQCETVFALKHIEEIAAMDGIDGIFIGPFDLSIDMGIPAQFDNPEFTAAVNRIQRACEDVNKPVYIYTNNPSESRGYIAAGYSGVANSMNSVVFVEAYKKIVNEIWK